jgi:truncated hemoglobin YjbI
MWAALDQGEGLSRILDDFYTRVFADARLSPFFANTKKSWVQEKQYSFLRQVFTGEKVYFGDRPRNAHHWMVISDELFDHREQLMREALERYGLAEPLIERWMTMEEIFRKQIVKKEPIPRKLRGEALPLDGYDALQLDIGTLCDGCSAEVSAGSVVRYHVRTGKTYCATCMPEDEAAPAL